MPAKRPRKGTEDLIERIEALERRIRELEGRPVPQPIYVQPVVIPAPVIPTYPYFNPYPWTITTCGQQNTCGSDRSMAGASAVLS
jgi:hypothetical protein